MTSSWKFTVCVMLLMMVTSACGAAIFYEPIPLSRCERNIPIYQLIPAALMPNGEVVPLPTTAMTTTMPTLNRQARQRQSSVVQQVVVNQSSNLHGGHHHGGHGGHFGGGGFGGGFGGHRPSFFPHRPSFGGGGGFGHPFRRTYDEYDTETEAGNGAQMAAPACPTNYLFSCEPKVIPAPCSASSGSY